jgi:hypothetical protein
MKTFFTSAILSASIILPRAEMKTAIPLWPDGASGAPGHSTNDIPTLTPYLPDPTNTTGVVMQTNLPRAARENYAVVGRRN